MERESRERIWSGRERREKREEREERGKGERGKRVGRERVVGSREYRYTVYIVRLEER